MMGQQPRTDSLFYYFRLEDQIPDDHLLKRLASNRAIFRQHDDLSFYWLWLRHGSFVLRHDGSSIGVKDGSQVGAANSEVVPGIASYRSSVPK